LTETPHENQKSELSHRWSIKSVAWVVGGESKAETATFPTWLSLPTRDPLGRPRARHSNSNGGVTHLRAQRLPSPLGDDWQNLAASRVSPPPPLSGTWTDLGGSRQPSDSTLQILPRLVSGHSACGMTPFRVAAWQLPTTAAAVVETNRRCGSSNWRPWRPGSAPLAGRHRASVSRGCWPHRFRLAETTAWSARFALCTSGPLKSLPSDSNLSTFHSTRFHARPSHVPQPVV